MAPKDELLTECLKSCTNTQKRSNRGNTMIKQGSPLVAPSTDS